MDGLINVTLIKSAQFDFTSLELEGNTLFIGANGAGKTTLLRAILFFYTANTQSLGISRSKKISFSDYYFEFENSYIVYTYKKDKKFILVIIYKDSNIKFRFALFDTRPNIKELFIKENKPLLAGEVWLKLKKISNLSNIVQNSELYREILYSKNQKYRYFSLFEAKEANSFTKTLSNIFINSKVDSDGIKKVIISSLGVDKSIDTQQILRMLKKFNSSYNDIVSFEKANSSIKNLIELLYSFENNISLLQQELMSLHFSKTLAWNKKDKLIKDLKDIENDESQKRENLEILVKKYNKNRSLSDEKIGGLKNTLKKIEQKKEYYKKQNIEDKIREYQLLDFKKADETNLKAQKDFFLKEHNDIEEAYKIEIEKIEHSFSNKKLNVDEKILEIERKKDKDINSIKDSERDALNKNLKDFIDKKDLLKDKFNEFGFALQRLASEKRLLMMRNFIFEDNYVLNKLYQEMIDNKASTKHAKSKLEKLDLELSLKKENIEEQKSSKELLHNKEIAITQQIIQKYEKIISPFKNTLMEKIYKNKLQSDFYIHFLKDDILHSNLDVKFDNFKNSIFELNLKDYKAPKNEVFKKLNEAKSKLNELSRIKEKDINDLNSELKNQENAIYREKRLLDELIKSNQVKLSSLESHINTLQNKQTRDEKNFKDKKSYDLKILENQHDEIKKQKDLVEEEINNLEKLQENREKSLKSQFTKDKNSIFDKYQSKKYNFDTIVKKLDEIRKEEIKNQEIYYQKKLKDKNVDINEVKKLEEKIILISNEIKKIEKYSESIILYNNDKKEYLDEEERYKKELKSLREKLEADRIEFETKKNELEVKIEKLQNSILSTNKEISSNKNELDRVISFEKSSTFKRTQNLNLEYTSHNIRDDIINIIERIENLDEKYSLIEKKITTSISKTEHLFGNSLNIEKGSTALKSAYNLKSYSQSPMIEKAKDLLGENIQGIIKHLIDNYDGLLLSRGKIQTLITKINKLFQEVNISVIDSLSLRYQDSSNKIVEILKHIKDENDLSTNIGGLFGDDVQSTKKQLTLLQKLIDTIEYEAVSSITIEDTFILEFRVIENGNDSNFVVSLDAVGSNGTDILVKGMIYIAMLRIFKEQFIKKEFALQVVLDEIGILSQRYLKELISFANQYGIFFINGAPDEKLINTYKRVCLVKRIGKKASAQEVLIYDEI